MIKQKIHIFQTIWPQSAILIIFILLFILACVEPFDTISSQLKSFVMVEAKWTNNADKNYVLIRNSVPVDVSTYSFFQPISSANVEIIEDNTTIYKLNEQFEGYYKTDSTVLAKEGHSYQLRFTLPNGQTYTSSIEKCLKTPEIETVSHQFGYDYYKTSTNSTPGYLIYVSTQDPANETNYYKWEWVLYEKQQYCLTCTEGLYYRNESTGDAGACLSFFENDNSHSYDYQCDKSCWDSFTPTQFYVLSDVYSDGLTIKDKLIGEMPIYQLQGSLLKIYQYCISKKYYDYVRLMESIGQNTGGLADTPPAALVGNIRNTKDSTEIVSGYFISTTISAKDYWLNKNDVPADVIPIGVLKRKPNPEPPTGINRPPKAPCYPNLNRTPYMPKGWKL